MKSKFFNKWDKPQKKEKPVQEPPQQEVYWEKKIKKLMERGNSYAIAYAMVSKRRIQELFEKDVKINDER